MLKILPQNVSNLIAAGEVIQRPASVVKELLENSVDAGSTSVSLILNDYGKTLIQVVDNGIGMDKEEAKLCFSSHATSKIESIEDLESIATFGFRGEALASIAACADVTLKTRKKGEDIGTQVHIESGNIVGVGEIAAPQGCNIAVRNIFYNIPARRKFLKSDAAEYRQILNEFIRVALTRLDIEFKLVSNSKEILHLFAGESFKQRVATIGNTTLLKVSKDLIEVALKTSIVEISGYIRTPQSAKKREQNTYMFVNNRYFRSPLLHKAIMNGYSRLLPAEVTPSYYLFLNVPSCEYDINISPSKTEVKFENEQAIFQIIEATVKEAMGKNAFADVIEFGSDDVPHEISSADGFTLTQQEREIYKEKAFEKPKIIYDPLFNPFKREEELNEPQQERFSYNSNVGFLTLWKNVIAVNSPAGEGIMIIDIERAKEKIFYDRYLKELKRASVAIQEELFPKNLSLNPAEYKVIMDNTDYLHSIGFEVRSFGKGSVIVSGTPSNFDGERFSVEECIEEIADLILKNSQGTPEALDKEQIARKVTAHTKFGENIVISQSFVNELLRQLLECEESALAPNGGYCYTILNKEQIKKILL